MKRRVNNRKEYISNNHNSIAYHAVPAALSIRGYENGDANPVWRLHHRTFEASPILFHPELDRDLRRIPGEYLDDGAFLVGEVAGEIVAVGGFRPIDSRTVEIKRMRVDPDHQRNGYGAALLDALEARARDLGFARVVLHTSELLEAATAFYRVHGYREVRREPHPVGDFELVHFEKSL